MAIAIAGNPRSGTSLTMNISAEAVGMDRIIGKKFGKLELLEELQSKRENESDRKYEMRMYNLEGDPRFQEERLEHYVNMNPKGFFEHGQFTVRGIRYRPGIKDDIKQLDEEDKNNPYIIKLVNSGLAQSDPRYVDKVIYLIRHPWDVAKSQVDLNRSYKLTLNSGLEVDLADEMTEEEKNECIFFLTATIQFAHWRVEHPDVPVLFVHFDDLIADPETQLRRMADFTGIPEYMKGLDIIDQKLGTRHKVEHDKREGVWEEALNVHNLFCEERFQEIVDFSDIDNSLYRKSRLKFFCPRLRTGVHYNYCLDCRAGNEDLIWSGISRNMINGWDWEKKPCSFECGFDPDDKNPKTVQESIDNNHWLPVQNSIIKKRPEFTPVI